MKTEKGMSTEERSVKVRAQEMMDDRRLGHAWWQPKIIGKEDRHVELAENLQNNYSQAPSGIQRAKASKESAMTMIDRASQEVPAPRKGLVLALLK